MTAIARDAVASDHLVYAWPFPLGPECDVSCSDDEQVVMCPSWLVGDRLGPGRHRWRTPDPMRPVAAFFVLTSPVEVGFDLTTGFVIPATGQPVRVRSTGSIQVRCADPGLLIAQFVGLPFDHVNEGIVRSVSRSVERMLARLLTRRVVMSGTPYAVTDPQMLGGIVDELVAYNPTAGAVFGVELIRMGHLTIAADDGNSPYVMLPTHNADWSGAPSPNGEPDIPLLETARGRPMSQHDLLMPPKRDSPVGNDSYAQSGEIVTRAKKPTEPGLAIGTLPLPGIAPKLPGEPSAGTVDAPGTPDDVTRPNTTRPAGSGQIQPPRESDGNNAPRGSILGIGTGHIGAGSAAGEIPMKIAPGARVLVPGPNGLMQSATVRQLLQGYYELEVGSSGETIWVPIGGVLPE